MEVYAFILPIASMLYDFDSRRVFKRRELYFFIVIKALAWIAFYIIYGVSLNSKSSLVFSIMNLCYLIFPCLAVGYSILIYKVKYLTLPLIRDAG